MGTERFPRNCRSGVGGRTLRAMIDRRVLLARSVLRARPTSSVRHARILALVAAMLSCAPGDDPRPPTPDAQTLRVVAYNIRHGRGTDDRVDLERVADVLRALDADVITLQEVDDRTERTGGVDQVAVLAQLLGYEGVHGPHRPYQGGFYGNAVLTRLPVVRQETHPIPGASGSALAVHETVVALTAGADASTGGRANSALDPTRVSVVSVHLAGSPEERMAQADRVSEIFADVEHPVVLAGDFNGRPDDPVVRRLAAEWEVLPKSGDAGTYPAGLPDREIDFVMIRPRGALRPLEHVVVPEAVASDHRPLLAVLDRVR